MFAARLLVLALLATAIPAQADEGKNTKAGVRARPKTTKAPAKPVEKPDKKRTFTEAKVFSFEDFMWIDFDDASVEVATDFLTGDPVVPRLFIVHRNARSNHEPFLDISFFMADPSDPKTDEVVHDQLERITSYWKAAVHPERTWSHPCEDEMAEGFRIRHLYVFLERMQSRNFRVPDLQRAVQQQYHLWTGKGQEINVALSCLVDQCTWLEQTLDQFDVRSRTRSRSR